MWMSIRQLSRLSGISEKRIRTYIMSGMKYYQETEGGRIEVRPEDLESYRERFVRTAEKDMPEPLRMLMEMSR